MIRLTKVNCKVRSCDFWGKGLCTADEILVNNDTIGTTAPMSATLGVDDVEFAAEEIGNTEEMLARTSRQTQCETMRPKRK